MKRLAGTVDVCNIPVRVMVADQIGYPPFAEDLAFGAWDRDTNTIWVNADYPPVSRWETLIHECLHAIWTHAGMNTLLEYTKHLSRYKREELAVAQLSTHVGAALESARKIRGEL